MEHGINYVNAFFASIRQNTGTDVRTRKPTDETGVKGQTRPIPDGKRSRGDQINLLTLGGEREKYAALPFLGKTSTLIFGALSHLGSKRRETGRGNGMAQDGQRTTSAANGRAGA